MNALRCHDPVVEPIPLVLDSPHSGTQYPAEFEHLPPRAVVRQAEDSYVEQLYAAAPLLGATLIEALFPRAYIDPNRHLSDMDPELLAEPWPEPVSPSDWCGGLRMAACRCTREGSPLPKCSDASCSATSRITLQ